MTTISHVYFDFVSDEGEVVGDRERDEHREDRRRHRERHRLEEQPQVRAVLGLDLRDPQQVRAGRDRRERQQQQHAASRRRSSRPSRGTLAPATTPIRRAVRITAMIQNGIESFGAEDVELHVLGEEASPDVEAERRQLAVELRERLRRREGAQARRVGEDVPERREEEERRRIRIAGASISHVEPVLLRLRERRRVAAHGGGPLLSLGCQVAPPLARRWSPLTAWGRADEPAPTRGA